jgi:hypothetical protein
MQIKNVFKKKSDSIVNCPVGFQYIISNIQGQFNINSTSIVDITIVEAFELIQQTYENLEKIHYVKPTLLFKTLLVMILQALLRLQAIQTKLQKN